MLAPAVTRVKYTHFHLFCGVGGGALGFNRGEAIVDGMHASLRCVGGVDVDPAAIRDFNRRVGVTGTVRDLFDHEQYVAYHGVEPPPDWVEALPEDILRAANYEFPDILFLSAPCKGFSGLLSETLSRTPKYQALNRLTLRGMWLALEAFKDNLPAFILFENVPRIVSRGKELLRQIEQLLRHYGYAVSPINENSFYDCGEIGGLGQSRKRFLMVARLVAKVPPFLYEPMRLGLRSVGEILEKLPCPGDPRGGRMHEIPELEWKTWVRLAFVRAGSDWRSLNDLAVENGYLRDYLIVPEYREGTGFLGVNAWEESCGAIAGRTGPTNGNYSVADPLYRGHSFGQFGVLRYQDTSGTVTSQRSPGQGTFSVADPKPHAGKEWHHNVYRIVEWSQTRGTVTGGDGPSNGGQALADPRPQRKNPFGKYAIARWNGSTGTVISSDDSGAYGVAEPIFAVVDPVPQLHRNRKGYVTGGHYGVVGWNESSYAVTSGKYDNGPWSVADPHALPSAKDKDVYMIRALDGTWHRPFTTLEFAALQSLIDPDELNETFAFDGKSDSAWRERIGNAVPPASAQAIASVMAQTLLMAKAGVSFQLSAQPIWVRPFAVAMSLDNSQSL